MSVGIVGRKVEVDSIRSFVGDDAGRARGLLVEGEAGIGKTTLVRDGIRLARERGMTVLAAAPSEAESSLPYSALADLIGGSIDPAGGDGASVLGAAIAGEPVERLAASRAALDLVETLSASGPVLVVVDDVQWLDAATEPILSYVLRRVAELPVRVVVARRTTESLPPPLGLDRALDERLDRMRLGPMTVGDLDRMLRARLDLRLARPDLAKLHRTASGNPFYALEIARALAANGDGEVHVPAHLGGVVEARLSGLSQEASDAVCSRPRACRPP